MCWTLNKANKIDYFKNVQMWYVREFKSNNYNDNNNKGGGMDCMDPKAYVAPGGRVHKKLSETRRDGLLGDGERTGGAASALRGWLGAEKSNGRGREGDKARKRKVMRGLCCADPMVNEYRGAQHG